MSKFWSTFKLTYMSKIKSKAFSLKYLCNIQSKRLLIKEGILCHTKQAMQKVM